MSETRPMGCGEAAAYLSALADGELAEPLRGRVEEHVAGCASCARELGRHQTIDALVASLPASRPSPHVLDNVLAAVRSPTAEPAVRESLRRRQPRLLPRSLPAFVTTRLAEMGAQPVRPTLGPRTRVSGALAALAAVLLVSLTFVAFSRLPSGGAGSGSSAPHGPPTTAGVLAETQARVNAVRTQVLFAPVLPAYLPPNVQLQGVSVATSTPTTAARYLDVVWSLPYPLGLLHLRESAASLSRRNDYATLPSNPALVWSLGTYQWTLGQVSYAPTHWAVGEDRGALSVTLDIGVQDGTSLANAAAPTNARAINVLRLTSLSLDAPFLPLTILPPDTSGTVLYYEAQGMTASGAATWKAYYDAAHQRERLTVGLASGELYSDVIVGGHALRWDQAAKTYSRMSASAAGGFMPLRTDVATFFNTANSLLADGELWNLGLTQAGGLRVYKLALVGAPYQTYVYVDTASRRVLGAKVLYEETMHPGTAQATSRLSPRDACPSYVEIDFMRPSDVPSGTFDASVPNGYLPGRVPQTLTCVPG